MTRIRKLDAVGFRGVRLAAPLEFTQAGRSMVVYGANGHGKSSYVDALECYFFARIGHLERENVSRAAYRHRAHPDAEIATVKVEFSNGDRNGSLSVNSARHLEFTADGSETEAFRQAARQELIILRHRDLSQFVDMTKREKLADLAPLLGMEVLDQTRTELQTAVRQLESERTTQDRLINERRQSVAQHLALASFNEAKVWEAITARLQGLGSTGEVKDASALKDAVARVQVSVDSSRDARARTLQRASGAIEESSRAADPSSSIRSFVAAFGSLASDEHALQHLALAGLWEAGLGVLRSEWWEEEALCPLCRQQLTKPEDLEQQLDASLSAAEDIRRRRAELETLREQAIGTVRRMREALGAAGEAGKPFAECTQFAAAASEGESVLAGVLELLRTPLEPGRTVSEDLVGQWDQERSEILKQAETATTALKGAASSLSMSEQERSRFESYRILSAVEGELSRLDTLDEERKVIDTQTRSMQRVQRAFEAYERSSMSHILTEISENVSKYYQRLHGGERYSNVRLEFLPEDRGLEFSLEAFGQQISPPRLVLSESHLNSLGLCLFLAAAREFNSETRFVVLDDIVNSFDADHRAQLADLLIHEFSDFQIIAFTHDPIWFDILRRMAPAWEVRRIVGWSYELGVQIELPPGDERARIEKALDEGEEGIGGNLARQYVESRLKFLCRELRAPVPYREGYDNERRGPEELFQALRRHVRSRLQFVGRDDPVWNDFGASSFLANLASHDQPAVPIPLSAGDVRFALEKLDQLVDLFRCSNENCRKWVWRVRSDPSSDECQCECGNLRFR